MCTNKCGQCKTERWSEEGYKRDFAGWVQYFHCNNKHLMEIPRDDGYKLAPVEKKTIGKSIAVFQLGEGADGTFLITLAGYSPKSQARRFMAKQMLREYTRLATAFNNNTAGGIKY
jgi:hypothetical protein